MIIVKIIGWLVCVAFLLWHDVAMVEEISKSDEETENKDDSADWL